MTMLAWFTLSMPTSMPPWMRALSMETNGGESSNADLERHSQAFGTA
jgi:hypothetical protein